MKFNDEQNIRIRHAPSKRMNNNNMIGSLLYRLELFSVCSSDGIMISDWATIVGYHTRRQSANYCYIEMKKLLGSFRKYSGLLALAVIVLM